MEQDPIRLKNLLKRARNLLENNGMRGSDADKLLAPAKKLLEDTLFWRHQSDGLAIFLSGDEFRHFELPYHFDEVVVVTDRYHIKPLLPVLSDEAQFYVLAFSQNHVRLLQGSGYSISELNLEGVAQSILDVLDPDRNRNRLQFYTGTPGRGSGKREAVFHGTGQGEEDHKKEIRKFFSEVDRGINEILKDNRAPLVLAGVDYLIPIYRDISKYPQLMAQSVTGNYDEVPAEELHKEAWKIVEPYFKKERDERWQRFKELHSTNHELAGADVEDVVKSAVTGRIHSLFVATDVQRWGSYDLNNHEVVMHDEEQPGDYDLLDLAAVHTLSKGGAVYTIPDGVDNNDPPLAALYRF